MSIFALQVSAWSIVYEGTACKSCMKKAQCTQSSVRQLSVLLTTPYFLAMSERRQHDRQHDCLGARRKAFVEGHFGHMKHNLRWRQFMRRGLVACRSEFRLLCAAINLSKLARWLENRAPCALGGMST